jgi:hypothetical protein
MKHVLSFIVYALLLSVIVGVFDVCFGNKFIDGFFPTGDHAWARWLIRGAFVIYLTIKRPINGIGR